MRAAHIFHHNDLDGIMSAAVFYEYVKYKERKYRRCKFYMIDYIKQIDLSEIPEGDMIAFLDYSFSNAHNLEELKKAINSKKYKIIWIDHHKTSLDVIDNDLGQIGHFDGHMDDFYYWIEDLYCATKLTYYWCMASATDTSIDSIFHSPVPEIIDYTNDHDLWKHNLYKTEEFVLGFSAENYYPKDIFTAVLKRSSVDMHNSNLFRLMINEGLDTVQPLMVSFVEKCIHNGEIIKKYNEVQYRRMLAGMSFEFTIKDEINDISYKCIAMNTGGNSSVFLDKYDEYDAVCLFTYNNIGIFKYSMFSKNKIVDLSVLCKCLSEVNKGSMGGGGHLQSAGFQHSELLITPNCEIIFKKNLIGKEYVTIKKK